MSISISDLSAVGAIVCAATLIGILAGAIIGAWMMRLARLDGPDATDPAEWTTSTPRCERCGAELHDE